jgi:hypothetical protein
VVAFWTPSIWHCVQRMGAVVTLQIQMNMCVWEWVRERKNVSEWVTERKNTGYSLFHTKIQDRYLITSYPALYFSTQNTEWQQFYTVTVWFVFTERPWATQSAAQAEWSCWIKWFGILPGTWCSTQQLHSWATTQSICEWREQVMCECSVGGALQPNATSRRYWHTVIVSRDVFVSDICWQVISIVFYRWCYLSVPLSHSTRDIVTCAATWVEVYCFWTNHC